MRKNSSDEKGFSKQVILNMIHEVSEEICNVKNQWSEKRAFQKDFTTLTKLPKRGDLQGTKGRPL